MNWLVVSQFLEEIETFTVTNKEVTTRDKMKYVTWNVLLSEKLVACNCSFFFFFFFLVGRLFYNVFVEVVTTSRKTPHLVFLAFSSAEAIDSI